MITNGDLVKLERMLGRIIRSGFRCLNFSPRIRGGSPR